LIDILHGNNPRFTLQMKRCAVDQTRSNQFLRANRTIFQRNINIGKQQLPNITRNKARTEIAVRLNIMGGTTDNGGMIRQIDRIRNHGRGCVRLRSGSSQNRDGIGNAE
jgi:hypothetical protein